MFRYVGLPNGYHSWTIGLNVKEISREERLDASPLDGLWNIFVFGMSDMWLLGRILRELPDSHKLFQLCFMLLQRHASIMEAWTDRKRDQSRILQFILNHNCRCSSHCDALSLLSEETDRPPDPILIPLNGRHSIHHMHLNGDSSSWWTPCRIFSRIVVGGLSCDRNYPSFRRERSC